MPATKKLADAMAELLRVEGLKVHTKSGRSLLQVPFLELHAGQSLSIEGPSGAGKSTFLYAVAGLMPHASGQVLWLGEDILSTNIQKRANVRRKLMGFVFQDFVLFEELTARANAGINAAYHAGLARQDIRAEADRLLDHFGLGHAKDQLVSTMSGGERQRVALARALATKPRILLADEPTASLDRANADSLMDDLLGFVAKEGKSLIMVSHDQGYLSRMNMHAHVHDGLLGLAA